MAPYEDGWVEGFPSDGEEHRAWKDDETAPFHHKKWDEALQRALDDATHDWNVGDKGEFTLTYRVRVTKTNPGWVDGYKVDPSS